MRVTVGLLGCVLAILSTASVPAQDPEFPEHPLPALRRVVFYNSGVAHMQHRGEVTDKAKLAIRFSAHDIDDVLKSLVFEDQGGGHVRAVEYQPAPNPEDVAANSFGPMTLAQLLQKYRGEGIRAASSTSDEPLTGQIFGLENRQFGDDVEEVVVLIDDAGGMRSVILNEIERVEFLNQDVRDEMKLAMTGITKSRKANQKQLDLLFDGQGRRNIAFGYVVDAPIWRMSYRLEVKPEQIQLQGWTHINNVTGVDWENVTVELRSGQPQTFHTELFAPVLSERASVGLNPFGLPEELTLVRQWYGFEPAKRFSATASNAYGDDFPEGIGGGMMGGMGGGFGGAGFGGGAAGAAKKSSPGRSQAKGIDSETAFRQIARLDRTAAMIRFQLDKPVSLASGKSAALPVFQKQLPSRLLSVVKHSVSADDLTAVRSIELTNATEFALVPGPISVSRDGDFVGDARIPRLPIGAATMLPYAIDRAVHVGRETSRVRKVATGVAVEGKRVITTFENQFEVEFTIDNQDQDSRLIVMEYELPSGAELAGHGEQDPAEQDPFGNFDKETPKLAEVNVQPLNIEPAPKKQTDRLITYEIPAAALSESKLAILVRWSEQDTDPLRNILPTRALAWLGSNLTISDATKAKLQELIEVTREIAQHEAVMRDLAAKKSEFTLEQTRIRENLRAVGASTAAAEPYLKRMSEMETAILATNMSISEAKRKSQELQTRRNKL